MTKWTDERRKLLSDKMKGKRNALGHKMTEAHKQKLREANKHPKSIETRTKMSEAKLGKMYKYTQQDVNEMIDMFQNDVDRKTIANKYDISYTTVCRIIKKFLQST